MSSLRNLVVVFPSAFLTGLASIHLVNLSTATSRYLYPDLAVLNFPIISSPQTANSQVIGIVFNAEPGRCDWLAYFWHLTHLLTMAVASAWAVSQQKPCRRALATRERAPAWCPQSPAWMSSRIFRPSSGWTQRWNTPVALRL